MNKLIKYGSTEKIPYYNCSGKTDEEWYATGRERPIVGWGLVIFGIIVETIYFPTIYIMFKTKLTRHSCYKIMAFLGIIDIFSTVITFLITGFLFIKGAVYCNYPTMIYIIGSMSIDLLFEGKRTYSWIILLLLYWFLVSMFTPTGPFNSVVGSWIRDPMVIENPSQEILDEYYNKVQLPNNYILLIGVCSLYTVFCVAVKKMDRGLQSKASKQVFIQSTIICFFNIFTVIGFNASILLPTLPWMALIGELSWSGCHSAPAFIYLTMNKVIRTEFLKMLRLSKPTKVSDPTSLFKHAEVQPDEDKRV